MKKRQTIDKRTFILLFLKKVWVIMAVTSLIWGTLRALCLHYDFFPLIDDMYISIGIPIALSIIIIIMLDKYTDSNVESTCYFQANRFLGFILGIMFTIVFYNVNTLVEKISHDVLYVETIDQSNLQEIKEADFVHIDKLSVLKEDVGRMDDSYIMPRGRYSISTKHIPIHYEICPLLHLPNVYVCKCRKGDDTTPLVAVNFVNQYLKRVCPSSNLREYLQAAEFCQTPVAHDNPPLVLEVVTSEDIERGKYALLYILCAILGGSLLWAIAFNILSKGDFYPPKHDSLFNIFTPKGTELQQSISKLFKPEMMFLWVVPSICIIVFIIEMLRGYSPDSSNNQLLLDMGGATPYNVIEQGQYWRLLTAHFVHAGFVHLASNIGTYAIAAFFCILRKIETKYIILLAIIYTISVLISNLWVILSGNAVVGASSGTFVLMGIYITHYIFLPVKEKTTMFVMFLFFLFFLVSYTIFTLSPGISFTAHISGLICGLVIQVIAEIFLWEPPKQKPKKPRAPRKRKAEAPKQETTTEPTCSSNV